MALLIKSVNSPNPQLWGYGVHTSRHIPLNPPLKCGTLIQTPAFLRSRGDKNTVKANYNTSVYTVAIMGGKIIKIASYLSD